MFRKVVAGDMWLKWRKWWFVREKIRPQHVEQSFKDNVKPFATNKPQKIKEVEKERPSWQIEKEVSKQKLNGEAWNPRKKLSPDTMEGIRHLNKTQPDRFTTPVLAQHFKVSPEAIKRILKSKWRPSDEEQEDRLRRWDKRGEQIWTNLVELGVKPPKRWREMGVGRANNGETPKWKSGSRNLVTVEDSFSDSALGEGEDILPVVDGTFTSGSSRRGNVPLSERMGV
ncbi:Required for respiratory growth protein 9 mitochondrial [Kalmusia sp. IMI 367209]|nr:Required for respiratory growth protein 9 mitochondrial [Kalmusia sp. IMI 367209]